MSDRTDLPKIKPDNQPSIFNQEAGKWGLLSEIAAVTVSVPTIISKSADLAKKYMHVERLPDEVIIEELLPLTKKVSIGIMAATVLGTVIGGISGKKKAEQEQVEGRVVKTPGYWNKGIMSGLLASVFIQAPLGYYKLTKENYIKDFAPKSNKLTIGFGIVAAVVGSIIRKNSLQRDYDKAVALQMSDNTSTQGFLHPTVNAIPAPTFKNSVSADEAALLDAKQNTSVSHAEKAQAPAATHEEHAVASASAEPVAQRA